MSLDKNGKPNPLDAWSQSIDQPPHQVGGRARTIIEKSRHNPNNPARRSPGSAPFDPGQSIAEGGRAPLNADEEAEE